ncbi:MAG: hypothetical protein IRZ14_15375 [Chloroflexi bacterium]|nr:hypothetical protein [Chloroflexota bacterium]
MRELPEPPHRAEPPALIEEYWERRIETADGRLVERRLRQVRWSASAASGPSAQELREAAAPFLRALLVTVVAPALGRLAVRALAPRLLAALPASPSVLRLARGQRRARRPQPSLPGHARPALDTPPPARPALPPGQGQ